MNLTCQSVRDKSVVVVELQLNVSLLEGCKISESEQNLVVNEKNRYLTLHNNLLSHYQ